jgi:hypothetical protein
MQQTCIRCGAVRDWKNSKRWELDAQDVPYCFREEKTMTMTPARLELDHPALAEACEKLVQAKKIRTQMTDIEEEQKIAIKALLADFPGTEKFTLPGHIITLGANVYQNAAVFKKHLLDAEVDPEIIQAATEAAKTTREPKLLVKEKK